MAIEVGVAGYFVISRDNDDPTAEAIFDFMRKAGIPRRETVLWNLIAGWNGTREITAREVREGALETLRLVRLMPRLKAVVLVGKRAERARPLLAAEAFSLSGSVHPSPIVRASRREEWEQIPEAWSAAYRAVNSP